MRSVARVQAGRNPEGAARRGWLWEWRRRCAPSLARVLALGLAPAAELFAAATALEVPYFLPVDISVVDVSVTTTAVGEVARTLPNEEKAEVEWKFSRSVRIERAGAMALKTVADPAAGRILRIPKATWSDVKATVELTEGGVLAGINASAVGRGDDFLVAVAKFAGVAAGFWTGAPLAGATVSTWKHQPKLAPFDVSGPAPSLCPPIDQLEAEGVPVEMQALVSLDPAGCAAFLRLREATEKVEAMRIQRDQLAEQRAGGFGCGAHRAQPEAPELPTRGQLRRGGSSPAARGARDRLRQVRRRRAAWVRRSDRAAFHELVPLDRLPAAAALGWLSEGAKLSRASRRRRLSNGGKWREMRTLFERSRSRRDAR